MKIELSRLTIQNFRGLKLYEFLPTGKNSTITGCNGVGKTSVYDAFLWLLFGKNSEGKAEFGIRPTDKADTPIKGLVTCVEAEICIDGEIRVFKRSMKENITKKKVIGYTADCEIDEVDTPITKYKQAVAKLIPEDVFKLITDVRAFCLMPRMERREMLVNFAGDVGTPEGFDELLGNVKKRSVKQYKKILTDRRKALEDKRDEINPRIDELQKGHAGYVATNTVKIEHERASLEVSIKAIDDYLASLNKEIGERAAKLEKIQQIKNEISERETELSADTGGIDDLIAEKRSLIEKRGETEGKVDNATLAKNRAGIAVEQAKEALAAKTAQLDRIRTEHTEAAEAPIDDNCPTCGQQLSEAGRKPALAKRDGIARELETRGKSLFAEIKDNKVQLTEQEEVYKTTCDNLSRTQVLLQEVSEYQEGRLAEISKLMAADVKIPPETDSKWKILTDRLKKAEKALPDAISTDTIKDKQEKRAVKLETLKKLNDALAQSDRREQDKQRIEELEKQERQIGMDIAAIEQELADIDKYEFAESKLLEDTVNGKFKYIKFRMFKSNLNGGVEQDCEATYNGTRYASLSTGEKIFVGIDIINVLSAHYGVSAPIFIDNAESLSLPIETNTQTVRLVQDGTVEKLKVEV